MASLNVSFLIGNVGRDPEMRTTKSGEEVASFSLAVSEQWKDKQTGEMKEATEWVNCAAYGKTASLIGKYVIKGSSVHLMGKIKTEKYQQKDTGADVYSTKVIVERIQFLGKKAEGISAPVSTPMNLAEDVPF